MKRINFSIILLLNFVVISCSKKAFSEYEENDFYEVQGEITSTKRTSFPFDSSELREIQYDYFIQDSLIFKGSENLSWTDLTNGAPIVVLVHKKESNISFYWKNGLAENIIQEQFEYAREIYEKAINDNLK